MVILSPPLPLLFTRKERGGGPVSQITREAHIPGSPGKRGQCTLVSFESTLTVPSRSRSAMVRSCFPSVTWKMVSMSSSQATCQAHRASGRSPSCRASPTQSSSTPGCISAPRGQRRSYGPSSMPSSADEASCGLSSTKFLRIPKTNTVSRGAG